MVLDFSDEDLTNCLKDVISGLLPHEHYEPEVFTVLYPMLKEILNTEDSRNIYYIMFTILDKYMSLSLHLPKETFAVSITRERFSNSLENNIPDLILEPNVEIESLMAGEGKSSDITIPTIQQEVMGIVFTKTMALYDECFSREKTGEDSTARLLDLKDCVKVNMIETSLAMQRAILSVGLKYDRKLYIGPKGWLDFTMKATRELSELDSTSELDLICDGPDSMIEHEEDENKVLGHYGIPQLDNKTPLLEHRLAVLVAKENVGKTKVMINLTASLLRNEQKVFFACGETSPRSLRRMILSSYIYQEYGMFFEDTYLHGEGFNGLEESDKQIVQTAKARVSSSYLCISDNLEYDTVTSKISHYANQGYSAFFIDHSQSLRGRKGRLIGDLVTGLALDCREMKNRFPIYIMVASHPSSALKDLLQNEKTKDIQQSPTAQSASLSQEADELFILYSTEYLAKQGLLAWQTNKRRDAPKPPIAYLKTVFEVSSYVYDPKNQGADAIDDTELACVLAGELDDDFDDDDLDGLDLEF